MRAIYRGIKTTYTQARTLFHRLRLSAAGCDLQIEPGVVFEQAGNINLGDGVRIGRRALLRANSITEEGSRAVALTIGANTSIMENCVLNTNTGHISIGANSWIGPGCLLYGNAGLDIGDNVLIAGHTAISTVSHRHQRVDIPINDQGLDCEPVSIGDDVWIGMNVSIVKGVRIGRGCIVGAGAVVTRDLPAFSIAHGIPARVVSRRDESERKAA